MASKPFIDMEVKWRETEYATVAKAVKQVVKEFKQFNEKGLMRAVETATKSAAKDVILPEARRHVPHETGALERSLRLKKVPGGNKMRKGYGVKGGTGIDREGLPYYALWQEFGWRPRNRHTGRFQGNARKAGKLDFGTLHPNAQPFLRPALFGQVRELYDHVYRVLERELFSSKYTWKKLTTGSPDKP